MTNIYLIRHAEAEGNIFRRMDGFYNSRITQNGQQQILALRQRFADIALDAVYASDLYRTCETAKALYLPKGLPLHKDARFREVCFGVQEDLCFGYLERFDRENMRNFVRAPTLWHAENAESFQTATDRWLAGLQALAEKHDGQSIAIFSHGGITGWAFRRLFGARMEQAGRCDNTGVSLLRWENGVFTPVYFYDNRHLPDEISTLHRQLWWRGTDKFNLWFRDFRPDDAQLIDPAFPMPENDVRYIAMRADEPVGYLSYSPLTGWISMLYLAPAHRGRRMGDQLIGQIVCDCRGKGLDLLQAKLTAEHAAATHLLLRHGAVMEKDLARLPISLPVY